MKKNILILSAIFAGILTSCAVEPLFEGAVEQTGTTTVTFTPNFGTDPETKAFAETPQVQNLYLAVFNEDGKALIEYVKADPLTLELATTHAPDEYAYTATLKLSDEPRVIHFIANAPDNIGYGSEEDAVGGLSYSFDKNNWTGQDAYWGYLELDSICDDSNTADFQELCDKLSSVELVRNFAKINVVSTTDKFVINRFWLSNFPEKASAAPYNREDMCFETGYADYDYASAAMASGYNGFCPATSGLVSLSSVNSSKLDDFATDANDYAYIYETEKPKKDALCIIVGGYYDGSTTETFYKLEIRGEDGDYLPILRNFTYTVTIGEVKKAGEKNVKDALKSIPSGGIDTNLDLKDMQDMSNGRSRIAVSETERLIFTDDPVTLEYMFVPDIVNNPDVVVNTTLDYLTTTGGYADEAAVQADPDHPSYVTIESEYGSTGQVIDDYTVADADKTNNYRLVTLNPVAIGTDRKTEVFTIKGHVYNTTKGAYETIQRTVTYNMRERLQMRLVLTPNKVMAAAVGEELTLKIGIEDKLPKSLFTLPMEITTEQMTLNPGNGDILPISSGKDENGPFFYMTKAITWQDYENATVVKDNDNVDRKYFTCHLQTNTKSYRLISDMSEQGDRIIVSNKNFDSENVIFLAGSQSFFKFLNYRYDKATLAAGRPAHILFGMSELPSDGNIFVKMKGIEPVNMNALEYQGEDGDFSVYQMQVSNIDSESIEIIPKAEAELGYFQLYDADFISSSIESIRVDKLKFSNLKLGINNETYVVVGREAQAKFHMDYPPLDGKVTIHLKNCTPVDNTLTGTGPDANGYTAYEIPAATNDISFPVKINTGVDKAFFKLTDSEFYGSDPVEAPVSMLQFSNVGFINGTLDYLLSNGTATQQLTFTLGDRPTTGTGNVILYLKGVTVNDMTSTGEGTGTYAGYDKYELNMADATAYPSLTVTLDITPKSGATSASVLLSHLAEFKDSDVKTVNIKTRYTIDWSKVQIKTDDTNYLIAKDRDDITVWNEVACTNSATGFGTYSTDNNGFVTNGSDVDAVDDGTTKYYFKFTQGGVDYISESGVTLATLASATSANPVVITCNIQKQTYKVELGALTLKYNSNALNGGTFTWSTSFASGGPISVKNGNPRGYNTSAFTITYKASEKIYIKWINGTDSHEGNFTIDQIMSGSINFTN